MNSTITNPAKSLLKLSIIEMISDSPKSGQFLFGLKMAVKQPIPKFDYVMDAVMDQINGGNQEDIELGIGKELARNIIRYSKM